MNGVFVLTFFHALLDLLIGKSHFYFILCGAMLLHTRKNVVENKGKCFVWLWSDLSSDHISQKVWVCVWSRQIKWQTKCSNCILENLFCCPYFVFTYLFSIVNHIRNRSFELSSESVFNLTQHLHRSIQFSTQIFTNKQGFQTSNRILS